MSALDAGYDVRSSGVTLDRFCGSGITAVAIAAASIISGMEDLVVAGGTEMMSITSRRSPDQGPTLFDSGNLHLRALHPQSNQGVCADAIATLERIPREALDDLALVSQQRAANAIGAGYFERSLIPVYHEDGRLALDREEYPRPQTTREALGGLKPSFEALADIPLDTTGLTYRKLIHNKYPDSGHRIRAPRRQFIGRRGRFCRPSFGLSKLRQGAWAETTRTRRGNGEHG